VPAGSLLAAFDAIGEACLDLASGELGGEDDAALRGCAGNLGDGKEWGARQRRRRIDAGATTIGQQERTPGAAGLGDALRIGERKQRPDRRLFAVPLLRCRSL
jgi:hypothetical protein